MRLVVTCVLALSITLASFAQNPKLSSSSSAIVPPCGSIVASSWGGLTKHAQEIRDSRPQPSPTPPDK